MERNTDLKTKTQPHPLDQPVQTANLVELAESLAVIARELGALRIDGCNDPQRGALESASADVARASLALRIHFAKDGGA